MKFSITFTGECPDDVSSDDLEFVACNALAQLEEPAIWGDDGNERTFATWQVTYNIETEIS
jgi:hypothetical protein